MSYYLVPKDEWRSFCITSYTFLNKISEDFNYKINKSANPQDDDPLEYRKIATPTIAMFLAFGVSEKEILEEGVKMAMKPITRQTSLNYLKSKGYTQLQILKLIIDNWDACPDLLKGFLRKYNPNFVFPVDNEPVPVLSPKPTAPYVQPSTQQPNPFLQQQPPAQPKVEVVIPQEPPMPRFIPPVGDTVNLRPVKPYAISFTNRDRAIAKYINNYLIDVMGYNTFDAIHSLFRERGATDFIFNYGKDDVITGEDFRRLRSSIQEYARSNFADVINIVADERINFYKFKLILVRFIEIFQYAPDVVHNPIAQNPIAQNNTQAVTQAPTPQEIAPKAYLQPLVFQEGLVKPSNAQVISVRASMQPVPQAPIAAQQPIPAAPIAASIPEPAPAPQPVPQPIATQPLSSRNAQMIDIFVSGLDAQQIRLAFVLLQDSASLQEFSESIGRRFVQIQG